MEEYTLTARTKQGDELLMVHYVDRNEVTMYIGIHTEVIFKFDDEYPACMLFNALQEVKETISG